MSDPGWIYVDSCLANTLDMHFKDKSYDITSRVHLFTHESAVIEIEAIIKEGSELQVSEVVEACFDFGRTLKLWTGQGVNVSVCVEKSSNKL